MRGSRWVLIVLLVSCGPGGEAGEGATDAGPRDATGGTDARVDATVDAPEACPAAMFSTFSMPLLESRSNVCVPKATCTFTAASTTTCGVHVRCEYELAGFQEADLVFAPTTEGWSASHVAGSRRHLWVWRAGTGMAYRVVGDVEDHHLCVFTDGATAPVFPRATAGPCPDLTRTFKLRESSPHVCARTMRCGLLQHETDLCVTDAWCTFPTGGSEEVRDIAITRTGSSATIVADTTIDPAHPRRYELVVGGDFVGGTGAATSIGVGYFFPDDGPSDPTCSWEPNGTF